MIEPAPPAAVRARPIAPVAPGAGAFPRLRWIAMGWLIFWGVSYTWGWGLANFLHLCDIAVIVTCIGLWRGSPLLLSSQVISSVIVDVAWDLDLFWHALTGGHLVGGTGYMWESRFPLWLRLLSLFHIVLPVLLVWSVRRVGYDPRGLRLQAVVALAALVASRFVSPEINLNFAHRDPLWHRSFGPAPVHLLAIYLPLVLALYAPVHLLLRRVMPAPRS